MKNCSMMSLNCWRVYRWKNLMSWMMSFPRRQVWRRSRVKGYK